MSDFDFKALRAEGEPIDSDSDKRDDDSDEDNNEEDNQLFDDADDEVSPMPMPPMRKYGNTGPKGVIRDYADADERLKKRTAEKKKALWHMAEKNSFSTTTIREDEEREALQKKLEESSTEDHDEDDDEDDDDDDDELKRLRAQRMAQLRKQATKSGNGKQKFVGGCPYIERLGTYDYMRVVQEEALEDQLVAVLIHDDNALDACDSLTAAYCTIARHTVEEEGRDSDEVRFCAMGTKDALDSFEQEALPAILVYRRGQLINCAMGLSGPSALERAARKFSLIEEGDAHDLTNASRRQALFDKAQDGISGLTISDDEDDDDYEDDDDDDDDDDN